MKCKHFPASDGSCLVCAEKKEKDDDLWLALFRTTHYLPKHLYDDLRQKLETLLDSPSPNRGQDEIHHLGTPLRIFVNNPYPPIPSNKFDWSAHYDDEEGPRGEGSTPYMAILDLIDTANPTAHLDKRNKPK